MESAQEIVIETTGLVKRYGDIDVLKSLDLAVPKQSIFGFLGPNGAGKTTTMKILLGLTSASGGEAKIFGQDVHRHGLSIRRRLGYLPQQPTFPPYMTIQEVLAYAADFYYSGPDPEIQSRIEEMLVLVGLEGKGDRKVKNLSGGERQRLGIAQAQIHAPDLLILDEPAASLDPIGRHDVLRIMEDLQQDTTIFYSTHILDDVQQVSDTVAILDQGRLIAQGSIDYLLQGTGEVLYELGVKSAPGDLENRLLDLPWVTDITVRKAEEETWYTIAVSDQVQAERKLLREVLADDERIVTTFRQKSFELEDVFLEMIRGE